MEINLNYKMEVKEFIAPIYLFIAILYLAFLIYRIIYVSLNFLEIIYTICIFTYIVSNLRFLSPSFSPFPSFSSLASFTIYSASSIRSIYSNILTVCIYSLLIYLLCDSYTTPTICNSCCIFAGIFITIFSIYLITEFASYRTHLQPTEDSNSRYIVH